MIDPKQPIHAGRFALALSQARKERQLPLNLAITFDPQAHPRDLHGQFRAVVGKLKNGETVRLPDGQQVTRRDVKLAPAGAAHHGKEARVAYEVRHKNSTRGSLFYDDKGIDQAAGAALDDSARSKRAASIGGTTPHENHKEALKAQSFTSKADALANADAANAPGPVGNPYRDDWGRPSQIHRNAEGHHYKVVHGDPESPNSGFRPTKDDLKRAGLKDEAKKPVTGPARPKQNPTPVASRGSGDNKPMRGTNKDGEPGTVPAAKPAEKVSAYFDKYKVGSPAQIGVSPAVLTRLVKAGQLEQATHGGSAADTQYRRAAKPMANQKSFDDGTGFELHPITKQVRPTHTVAESNAGVDAPWQEPGPQHGEGLHKARAKAIKQLKAAGRPTTSKEIDALIHGDDKPKEEHHDAVKEALKGMRAIDSNAANALSKAKSTDEISKTLSRFGVGPTDEIVGKVADAIGLKGDSKVDIDAVAAAWAEADPYGDGDPEHYKESITDDVVKAAAAGDEKALAKALNEADDYTAYPGEPDQGGHTEIAKALLGQLAGRNVEATRGGAADRGPKSAGKPSEGNEPLDSRYPSGTVEREHGILSALYYEGATDEYGIGHSLEGDDTNAATWLKDLERMEKEGLVARQPNRFLQDTGDSSQIEFDMTDKGEERFQELDAQYNEGEDANPIPHVAPGGGDTGRATPQGVVATLNGELDSLNEQMASEGRIEGYMNEGDAYSDAWDQALERLEGSDPNVEVIYGMGAIVDGKPIDMVPVGDGNEAKVLEGGEAKAWLEDALDEISQQLADLDHGPVDGGARSTFEAQQSVIQKALKKLK